MDSGTGFLEAEPGKPGSSGLRTEARPAWGLFIPGEAGRSVVWHR